MSTVTILQLLGTVAFGLGAFSCPWPKKVNYMLLGMFFWSLSLILPAL